ATGHRATTCRPPAPGWVRHSWCWPLSPSSVARSSPGGAEEDAMTEQTTDGRRRGRDFARAVLSLGLLVGLGVTGTLAYWTDEGAVTTGSLHAARLDLTVNGQLGGAGGTTTDTSFAIADLVPGES